MKRRPILALVVLAVCVLGLVTAAILYQSPNRSALTKVSFRLLWYPQCQFAGFIVAKDKGFYKDAGLEVDLRPAGPDLKPHVTVAAGTDDIGITVPNSILGARSNGVPLVAVMQVFQDSPNRYVLKKENQIKGLRELRGRKVGLWLGGDEAEFVSMLATAGMALSDVNVVPQKFSVVPFLENQYVLSQVTVYNELILIAEQGCDSSKLQILSPKDYNSAILGDVVFTTEEFATRKPEVLRAFLEAALRGWRYCLDHRDEAVTIVLKHNPELKRDHQRAQLDAVLSLLTSGPAPQKGLGYIDATDYATAERVIFDSGQIKVHVDPKAAIDMTQWERIPDNVKVLP